jgi:hypothetical protein
MKNWTNDQLFSAIFECSAQAALIDERRKDSSEIDQPILYLTADRIDQLSYDARDELKARFAELQRKLEEAHGRIAALSKVKKGAAK